MKKMCVFFLALLLLLFSSGTPIADSARYWQHTSRLSLEIGIRDKYGNFTNTDYTANFIIYDPNGKPYYYTAHGSSDNFVGSKVPNDYKGLFLKPGDYSWQCYVSGEVVASGGFRVSRDGPRETISVL